MVYDLWLVLNSFCYKPSAAMLQGLEAGRIVFTAPPQSRLNLKLFLFPVKVLPVIM